LLFYYFKKENKIISILAALQSGAKEHAKGIKTKGRV